MESKGTESTQERKEGKRTIQRAVLEAVLKDCEAIRDAPVLRDGSPAKHLRMIEVIRSRL